jgi:hypothetical protein
MTLPKCPVCGGEVAAYSEQKTLPASQSVLDLDQGAIVCHCTESHRFVVSSRNAKSDEPEAS